MAGTGCDEGEGPVADGGDGRRANCSFVWDDDSQLYYHASSGFYHDPNAGWYYSTRDGRYYKFENGGYLPWESDEKGEECHVANSVSDARILDQPGSKENGGFGDPSPPSEWLEETLINLYLRGYSADAGCSSILETGGRLASDETSRDSVHGNYDSNKFNEAEDRNVAEDVGEPAESSGNFSGEDALNCEETWLAQYGQVVKSEDESLLPFPVIDLWDWRLVEECGKKTNNVSRLVGRLVKRSMQLHPSMPAGGGIFKTAPVCEVHLDLVQVATGKIYRLRCPSAEYLLCLSSYDSSNPTRDWAFPRLNMESLSSYTALVNYPTEASDSIMNCKGSSSSSHKPDSAFVKHNYPEYRDRAAERRALHGSFGIGPGEKNFSNDNVGNGDIFAESPHMAETVVEAINIPFGDQSYGKRVLKSMGWKEGEALGRTKKGLLQPLQVAGNKGNAGLGWSSERKIM